MLCGNEKLANVLPLTENMYYVTDISSWSSRTRETRTFFLYDS